MQTHILKKSVFLFLALITIVLLAVVLGHFQFSKNSEGVAEINDNVQVISIFAKNGFSPTKITAKAGTASIIRIETKDTYDCTAALVIPSLNYSKFLPASGITDIQLLPQETGSEIVASCSMGMYGFTIEFV